MKRTVWLEDKKMARGFERTVLIELVCTWSIVYQLIGLPENVIP
jgi:hypothetical protein